MKFRIIKILDSPHYFIIQKKNLFFWQTIQHCIEDDLGRSCYDYKFDNVEKAEIFINKIKPLQKVIIKHINHDN